MFLNCLLLEKQPFLTIQEIFYMFFSDFLFYLCFRYFFIILLEVKHTLFELGIIFIFFGPSTAISSSDGISVLSPKFISLMTPSETFFYVFCVGIIKQTVFNIYVFYFYLIIERIIFIILNTSSTKSIRSFCLFCSVAALSVALNFCSRSKNSSSSFFVSIFIVSASWTWGST